MASDFVLNGRAAASIGHELEACAGRALKKDAAHMSRAAGPDGCGCCLIVICLEPSDQFLEVVRRKIFSGCDENRAVGQQRYRFKILEHVILDRIHGARAYMAEPIADADRVAVRRRACGAADADAAARASDVLDYHGLAERDRQLIGKYTRDRVGDPAGRYRHDDGDGVRRIGLRRRNMRHRRQRGSARCQMQELSSVGKFHLNLPSRHSITSSARASTVAGISRPSALAVLRLMTSWYLVGACTGRSPGFSPFRMRST